MLEAESLVESDAAADDCEENPLDFSQIQVLAIEVQKLSLNDENERVFELQ